MNESPPELSSHPLSGWMRDLLAASETPAGELALGLPHPGRLEALGIPVGVPGMAVDASWDPRMPVRSGVGPVVVWRGRPMHGAGGAMPLEEALRIVGRAVTGERLGRAVERAAQAQDDLAAEDRQALAEAVTRQISHLQGLQLTTAAGMLADAQTRHPSVLGEGARVLVDAYSSAQASLSAALTVSSRTAGDLLGLAFQLSTALPATLEALERGRIDLGRARAVAHEFSFGEFTDIQVRALEAQALAGAEDLTAARLRARVQRIVEQADPDAAQRRRDAAHKDRGTRTRNEGDGIASLTWTDDAAVIYAAQTRLDDFASAQAPGDGRSRPARRADALADLVLGSCLLTDTTDESEDPADPATPDAKVGDSGTGGRVGAGAVAGEVTTEVKLVLHVHQDVVRRMADGELQTRGGMAYLDGFGGIAPEQAEVMMAAATRMSIAVTDDDGYCLHESATHRYTPPAQTARNVRAQHRRCRFPGCRRPADQADLDHRREHPEGPTCECNLQPLCRHHHNLKTHGGWRVRPADPTRPAGILIWTSPAGREYLDRPEDPLFGLPPPEPPVRRGFGGDRDDPPF